MVSNLLESLDTWADLQITQQDVEFLNNYLFEQEVPLATNELALALIHERNRAERFALRERREGSGRIYVPKDAHQVGDELTFPNLAWKRGKVTEARPGANPEIGAFSVLTVDLDDGSRRLFASQLAQHSLNDNPASDEDEGFDAETIAREYGNEINQKLEAAFSSDAQLVRIAGRWFPRALLIDVREGNLNLAEAVLDMAAGEPMSPSALLKDIALPEGENPKLTEFSLNFALQEDGRFDEVGPAGEVLWCLKRLEPDDVRNAPLFLQYDPIEYDRSLLDDQMLKLASELDDELSEIDDASDLFAEEASIALIYPHLRAGTLPVSTRVQSLFPTAYETPRIRFTLVDGKTRQRIPAWIVREHRYVSGLQDWYRANGLMPGSLVTIRRSIAPGEVVIEAQTYRATKDWVRTAIVGADGGVVFAMLKQAVSAEFNDRMAFAIPSFDVVDALWTNNRKRPFEKLVIDLTRELSKLTPQGHVHAQELYAAVNIVHRAPPAPLFALLANRSDLFAHVGDLHFRLREAE